MIKGISLALSAAIFITSLVFTIANFTNVLKENIITGAAINSTQLATYSIIPLVLSFVAGIWIILTLKKSN